MGLAFYGRHFGYSGQPQAGSPQTGAGAPGPITKEAGYLSYNEICKLSQSGYTFKFDDVHGVPFAYNGNQWIGFDDPKSIEKKVQLANSLNMGGVMVWSVESDDVHGECGEKFPLLSAINRAMGNNSNAKPDIPANVVTKKPDEVTTSAPVVNNPSESGADCRKDGAYAFEKDCTRFFRCVAGRRYDYTCPASLHFDVGTETCTWPEMANCGY